jgi:alpha-N-arabinofuranosidase
MAYRNPIVPGFHPDPSVCVVGDTFYLATSSFEYFPGVPIYASTDLVTWRRVGHALTRASQLPMRTVEASGGVFAPTLRHHRGRWYLATCCTYKMVPRTGFEVLPTARGFYVWTDDIAGAWSDPVFFDATGIDQDVSRLLYS